MDNYTPSWDDTVEVPATTPVQPQQVSADASQQHVPTFENTVDMEEFNTPAQELMAGLEGIAEGIAGPLATLAETELLGVKKEDILARREASPMIRGAGQALGIGTSLFTGVGVGALAGKAGSIAAKAAGIGEATLGAKLASTAINESVQNAILQGSDEVSRMIINDPNASAENAIANVGLAAALGGATGVAIGSVSPLFKATVGDELSKFASDMKSRWEFRKGAGDLTEAAIKELENVRSTVDAALKSLYSGEGGGLKGEAIAKALPEISERATSTIQTQAQEVSDLISNKILEMEKDELLKGHTNKMVRELRMFQEAVTNPEASYKDIYDAINTVKRNLDEYGKFKLGAEESIFGKEALSVSHKIRGMLEDTEVWGEAANVQKEINSLFHDYSKSTKDITSKFLTKVDNNYVVDPNKIKTYLNNIGKPNAELKQEMMANYLERTEKLVDKVNKLFVDKGMEAPIPYTSTTVLNDTLGKKSMGAKLVDALIDKEMDQFLGRASSATVGAAAFGPFGALLGESVAAPMVSKVLRGLTKSIVEGAEGNGVGLKSAYDYVSSAIKAQERMSKAVDNVFKGAKASTIINISKVENDRNKLDKIVSDDKVTPESITSVDTGKLDHYMTDHKSALTGASVNALQYLKSLKPHPFRSSPLDKEIPPSKAEMDRYNRALDIAQEPLLVLEHIKKGTLQATDIKELATMYPSLYSQFKKQLMNQITNVEAAKVNIPYHTRVGLSLFLGEPLDSSMKPEAILAAQPKPVQNQPQGQPVTQNKKNTSSLGKNISSYMTPQQASQADRLKK